ncbi:hypothetical protein [Bradyrhizobium sp. HKCCYLRH3061]|uniref:hypothetical protein n=1 Tax=Bradyrhizobium sp. HKCCYLRH3061 TaxID=3420734 RepID=UPI003EBC2718
MTAGAGPIPATALNVNHTPIEDIEQHLLRLPIVSSARLLVRVPRPDSFIDLAERGLFVYDWTDVHRSIANAKRMYELVAVPASALLPDRLSGELHILADPVQLPDIRFGNAAWLDIQSMMTCVVAD